MPTTTERITEPMYPLNDLLSIVYPDLAPWPCAECCKAAGLHCRADKTGAVAVVCERCSRLPGRELDFTLLPNELEIIRIHSQPEVLR